MRMSSRAHRARALSMPGLAGVLASLLLAVPSPAVAQAEECGGWMVSCASVQVHAEDDRLFFYVPNATYLPDPAATTAAGERVRVYATVDGMTCDPATGAGCVDITESWLGTADAPTGVAAAGGASGSLADPGNRSCEDEVEWMDPARGLTEEDRRRCGRPIAAYFIVALPAAAFLFAGDGDEPDVVLPIGGDPQLPGGSGTDDGSSGSDDSGSGDGGSNGGTGGEAGGGSTGGGNTGGGEPGGGNTGGGEPGGGLPGGGEFGGGLPGGGGGSTPPMGEVPEPISTTLVGIGLLGYAGARLRRNRADAAQEEDV